MKCCCGKLCNGVRGLKMHQRSCRLIKSLTDETLKELEETENINTGQDLASVDFDSMPTMKPSSKLRKSDDQWKTTNAYFVASLPISEIDHKNISMQVAAMNSTIYNYFHDNFGTLEDTITLGLFPKYNDMSKKELKSNLHQLKTSRANPLEIKYVAKLLRSKLKATPVTVSPIGNDIQVQKNFWGYIKANFQQSTSPTPAFNAFTCTQFFHNFFRCRNLLKSFSIPNWIPHLAQPSITYDLSPSSYQQITQVTRKMKASGSPCPLDKISIIPFKRCPYLRSYLTELFSCHLVIRGHST